MCRGFGLVNLRLARHTTAMPGPDDQARLAEALRANLRRRKDQARAKAASGAEGDPAQPISQRSQARQTSPSE